MANILGPDCSFYQNNPSTPSRIDFVKMKAAGAKFVIIRAGQGEWPDPDFAYNWFYAREAGLPRGSYWYYDSRVSPQRQTDLWHRVMNGDYGELPHFADFEESYGGSHAGPANFKLFLQNARALFPLENELGIYTAYYYWRDHVINAGGDLAYFHQFPLWIANYGVTQPLVPTPWTSNEWLFWQFTENGPGYQYGAESQGIDLNYFHGDAAAFSARFPRTPQPEPLPTRMEVHIPVYEWVMYHEIYRFGSWCYCLVIQRGVAAYQVIGPVLKVVSQVQRETGAQFVVNGGGFRGSIPVGLLQVAGRRFSAQLEFEPHFDMDSDESVNTRAWNERPEWNAIATKRFIVQGGVRAPNTSAAWRELHPRTLAGVGRNGETILVVADGRQPGYSRGMDLYESADVMIELGAVEASDLDGGGSSTMNHNGRTCNVPIDSNVPGRERAVLDSIAIFVDGGTPPPPDTGGTMTVRGTVKPNAPNTNVKRIDNGVIVAQLKWDAALSKGDQIEGDLSPTGSDIINAMSLTRADGSVFPFPAKCKAVVNNLIVEAIQTDPEPPPPPPSTGTFTVTQTITVTDDETGETWAGTSTTILTKQ